MSHDQRDTQPYADDQGDQPLFVSGKTDPGKLAKTIAMSLHEQNGSLRVRAMGPHAVNQAVKGLIIARQQLAAQACDMEIIPAFSTHREGEDDVTLIVFYLTLLEQN